MERIVIPGRATHLPVALTDLFVGAPLASRVLLGATAPGQMIAAASFGFYVSSAARDAWARRGVRPIDFKKAFGADVDEHETMPVEARRFEIELLARAMDAHYTPASRSRPQTAEAVDRALTDFIAGITGQEIVTSTAIRSFTLAKIVAPFAAGSCDPISGDVAIYHDLGLLEPHVIAHEFAHRKGYLKELHAQVLSYAALRSSGDPELVQAARLERLSRQIRILQRLEEPMDVAELLHQYIPNDTLREQVLTLIPSAEEAKSHGLLRSLYDKRMRLTGQNGLSDYDEGFTNVLWTFGRSESATVDREAGAI